MNAKHTPSSFEEEEFLRNVGFRIREFRQKSGMTQIDLSEASGLWQTDISRFETGRSLPAIYHLYLIGNALGIHPSRFLEEE